MTSIVVSDVVDPFGSAGSRLADVVSLLRSHVVVNVIVILVLEPSSSCRLEPSLSSSFLALDVVEMTYNKINNKHKVVVFVVVVGARRRTVDVRHVVIVFQ